jgi:hypothetical protein
VLLNRGADLTGGLFWHLRAVVARKSLWAPFRSQLEDWLAGWTPATRNLLLVGPSAGWCLPDSFLTRFDHLLAVDIDPAAPSFFRLLHGGALRSAGASLTWSCRDFFADPAGVLAAHSDAAVLFCNVAGQRCVQVRDPQAVEAELAALQRLLHGRNWASFHDLLSARTMASPPVRSLSRHMGGHELLSGYGLGGEWFDHLTGQLLPPSSARLILPWRFKRGRLHLIEAGWVEG